MEGTKKGFNWGHGLTIGIVSFMAFIVVMVVMMFQEDVHLVSDYYYGKGVVYEDQIERERNFNALDKEPTILTAKEYIELQFPEEYANKVTSGTMLLYRPANADMDTEVALTLNEEGKQMLAYPEAPAGNWRAKLIWEMDGKEYSMESLLYF